MAKRSNVKIKHIGKLLWNATYAGFSVLLPVRRNHKTNPMHYTTFKNITMLRMCLLYSSVQDWCCRWKPSSKRESVCVKVEETIWSFFFLSPSRKILLQLFRLLTLMRVSAPCSELLEDTTDSSSSRNKQMDCRLYTHRFGLLISHITLATPFETLW